MKFLRDEFEEIVEVLAQRLNDTGKNWRHVYKVSRLLTSQ